ncbi:MAG: PBP1A family penicillin-binding protein [Candidatus Melainabacteria bacterium]|nr:PBP1A family penicillin-binding protein [Candidatus Melainabacteria bacterium]
MRPFQLPVDVPRKSEIVQNRIGFIIVLCILAVMVFLLFLLSVNVGFLLAKGAAALPDIRLLENWRPNESTRIYDRYGSLVANIHGDEDRVVVRLSQISPNVQRAVMAIEDNRFYQHNGVDFRGTFRALIQNARGGDVQGGSTLTQQLIKNLFLTPERSIGRKLAEALLAMRVESYYSKNTILEMYLNQVYWGNQAYGIEKAARRYFKKPAADLTIAESAMLAGLLKAPEGLSPFAYPQRSRERQQEVLNSMVKYGYITEEQRRAAAKEELSFNDRTPKPSKYPYFVTYVIQDLIQTFNRAGQNGEDLVRRGGLEVFTTVDPQVQEAAEKALLSSINSLPKYSMVTQGALVAIDVKTGNILAMVGGKDFQKSQFNNVTQARRAAGSTFKPVVYLTGFRMGIITPQSIISDRPVYFNTGYSVWTPKNWDGRFMGPMTVRQALALSRNTTTVQVGMKVGIKEVIETAKLAGITSPIDPNFSSLLGSSGISPLEMATVYSTFARGGMSLTPTGVQRVENTRGEPVELRRGAAKQVFDSEDVWNLVSILVDVVEKGTGKSAQLPKRQVAGKTGTTDKVRDIWFAGFTPDMVCVVWMGNEKYVPLRGVFSSNAAKVWHDFADAYYQITRIQASTFPTPQVTKVSKQIIDVSPTRPSQQRAAGQKRPDSDSGNSSQGEATNNTNAPAPPSLPAPPIAPESMDLPPVPIPPSN